MALCKFNGKLLLGCGHVIHSLDLTNFEKQVIKIPDVNISGVSLQPAQIEQIKYEDNASRARGEGIMFMEGSKNGDYLVVSVKSRQIVVFDTKFQYCRNILTKRAISQTRFGNDCEILVADKTGDLYKYAAKPNSDSPTLLLGHLSVLMDVLLLPSAKFIVSCDRDEKVRISQYPNCYNIERFCLGHREFVTRLAAYRDDVLISASGDGTLKFWSVPEGKLLLSIDTDRIVPHQTQSDFCEELAEDNITVNTLPIDDMQVYSAPNDENVMYVAISIHRVYFIALYKIDFSEGRPQILNKSQIGFSGHLKLWSLSNTLYIFTSEEVLCHSLKENDYGRTECKMIQAFFKKHLHDIKNIAQNEMKMLFKKNFDCVQDYYERKKARLQLSSK